MTRQEVLERLCALQEEVAGVIGYEHSADCFCGKGGFWDLPNYSPGDYRNDGVHLAFIEEAVRAALGKTGEQK